MELLCLHGLIVSLLCCIVVVHLIYVFLLLSTFFFLPLLSLIITYAIRHWDSFGTSPGVSCSRYQQLPT